MEVISQPSPIRRRRFLQLAIGSGACAATGFIAIDQYRSAIKQNAVTRTSAALGSEVTLTVLGTNDDQAQRALDAAFHELETVEQVMSLYRRESQLSVLNRERHLSNPHPYLTTVLSAAASFSRASNGAFDVTVQPLWELFSTAHQAGRIPTDDEVAARLSTVDWRGIEIQPTAIRLNAPVTAITLNGIAQGFATDRVATVLKEHGIEHALINVGEIGVVGHKPNGEVWKVGIQHPRKTDAFVALAGLAGRALATSGDYETAFSSDFSKNHIFDPATGNSPSELASVSIVAPTAMSADALSTAAMVLGPERTLEVIKQFEAVDALFVLKNGRVLKTDGFPEVM